MRSQAEATKPFLVASRLLDAHSSIESLAAIGHAFLEEAEKTGRACPTCLPSAVDTLLDRLDWRAEELLQMKPALIRAGIKRKAIGDFERGRIVHVGGWMLGETEVRLCAVAAFHTA
jgi:hypothetical protein